MNITITLSEEDQSLQAEILKVLLTPKSDTPISDGSDKSDKSDETPKATTQPTPKPYPLPTDPAPSDTSDSSDTSDKAAHPSDSSDTSDPSDKAAHPSDTSDKSDPSDKTALSMADLRKSVNAISRKKGLNWLYSWLGDLGVKSISDIPVARLEEAFTKLQNYA